MNDIDELLSRSVVGFEPDVDGALEETYRLGRARHRRQQGVALLVALGLFGITAAVIWTAFVPLGGSDPERSPRAGGGVFSSAPEPSNVQSHEPPPTGTQGTNIPPGFVETVVISTSRTKLVVQAPPERVRWVFDGTTCSVQAKPLNKPGGGGFGGAGCGGDAYFAADGPGGLGLLGASFNVVSGRVLPEPGVIVRVTLADGRSIDVNPSDGLWMVVVQRCGDYFNTKINKAVAISPDGQILGTQRFGPEVHPVPC
jgi:hypothetical protein